MTGFTAWTSTLRRKTTASTCASSSTRSAIRARPRASTGYLHVFQNGTGTDVYVDGDGPGTGTLTLLLTLAEISAASLTDSYFMFQ